MFWKWNLEKHFLDVFFLNGAAVPRPNFGFSAQQRFFGCFMVHFVFEYLKFCFYKLKGFSASSASFTATLHEYDCDHKNFCTQFIWPISAQNSRTTYFFLLNWSYFSFLYEIQNHYFFKFYSEHNITNCIRRWLVILKKSWHRTEIHVPSTRGTLVRCYFASVKNFLNSVFRTEIFLGSWSFFHLWKGWIQR